MGELRHFDLGYYVDTFDIGTFVETGTFTGSGLAHAAGFNFKKLHSIDVDASWVEKAQQRFKKDKRINVIQGRSSTVLRKLLPKIKGRILFWLDAHYPGEAGAGDSFGKEPDDAVRLPLEQELRAIAKYRKGYGDVILVDDLRIYEDGSYDRGNWERRAEFGKDNCKFVERLFGRTHTIERDTADAGYLVLTPGSGKVAVIPPRLKIAHFCQYAPSMSGMYETVRELILAERRHGAQAELIDVASGEGATKKYYGRDEIQPVPFAFADDADILCWHRQMPERWLNTPDAILVLFCHGTPEFCFMDELHERDKAWSLIAGCSKDFGGGWPGVSTFVTMWKRHIPYWQNVLEHPERLLYVNPWVDTQTYKLKRDTFKKGRLRLGLVDQWRTTKEPFALLNAVQLLVRQLKGVDVTLDVWGQEPEIPRAYLVQAQHLINAGIMHMRGGTTCPEKHIYPKVDLVLSTVGDESRVVREALATGTPVVCSRKGALFPCWQEDGLDLEALTGAMQQAYKTLCNEKRRLKLRRELRTYALEHFDLMDSVGTLVSHFEQLRIQKGKLKRVG